MRSKKLRLVNRNSYRPMTRIDLNPEPETSKLKLKNVITRRRGVRKWNLLFYRNLSFSVLPRLRVNFYFQVQPQRTKRAQR